MPVLALFFALVGIAGEDDIDAPDLAAPRGHAPQAMLAWSVLLACAGIAKIRPEDFWNKHPENFTSRCCTNHLLELVRLCCLVEF